MALSSGVYKGNRVLNMYIIMPAPVPTGDWGRYPMYTLGCKRFICY